jgi:hypothetical protein
VGILDYCKAYFSGEVNSEGKKDSVFVVTADPKMLKRSLMEVPIEKSAKSIRELPKFRETMKSNKEPNQ